MMNTTNYADDQPDIVLGFAVEPELEQIALNILEWLGFNVYYDEAIAHEMRERYNYNIVFESNDDELDFDLFYKLFSDILFHITAMDITWLEENDHVAYRETQVVTTRNGKEPVTQRLFIPKVEWKDFIHRCLDELRFLYDGSTQDYLTEVLSDFDYTPDYPDLYPND